jgi:hypothetical protein
MYSSDRVVQLYPQVSASYLVAFYDYQGCDGNILTGFNTGNFKIITVAKLTCRDCRKYCKNIIKITDNLSEV